jgi:hypothetical protein
MPAESARGSRGESRRRQIVDGALAAIRVSSVADVQLAAIAERAGMRANHWLGEGFLFRFVLSGALAAGALVTTATSAAAQRADTVLRNLRLHGG